MLNIDYLNLKRTFSSVVTVATAGKLSKENFLLHLKECNTKTTQENLYQKLLKLIRGLISSNASRS